MSHGAIMEDIFITGSCNKKFEKFNKNVRT